jgi:prophage maintenance system killer protein
MDEAEREGDPRMAPPQLLEECDEAKVRSALAGPQSGFGDVERYPSLPAKAAVLSYRLAKGHACTDGNKRLALILASAFLEANGFDIDAEPAETEHVFRHVAASKSIDAETVIADLEGWFADAVQPLDEQEE